MLLSFLLDADGENAIIREASGEIGQKLKYNAQSFRIASSPAAVAFAIANSKPRVVRLAEDKRGSLALSQVNGSQAEAAIPLIVGDQAIGALDIHSRDPLGFLFRGDDCAANIGRPNCDGDPQRQCFRAAGRTPRRK